jgi:hypothetical protein
MMPRSMRRLLIATCMLTLALPATTWAGSRDATAQRLTGAVTNDIQGVLTQARSQLVELSELPGVESGDGDACAADLANLSAAPRYTALGASDLQGNLYCLTGGLAAPVSIADRAYFLRTLGTRDLGVGDFQIGRATGANSIGLGFPITPGDGDEITGIVLSPLSLNWLENRVLRRHSAKAVDTLVIDEHGTVLARAGERSTPSGVNLGSRPLVERMLSERQEGVGGFSFAGERVRAAYDVVPLSGGAIHVAVSVPAG